MSNTPTTQLGHMTLAAASNFNLSTKAGDVDTMLLMKQNLSPKEISQLMSRIKHKRVHSFIGKMDSVRFAFLQDDLDRQPQAQAFKISGRHNVQLSPLTKQIKDKTLIKPNFDKSSNPSEDLINASSLLEKKASVYRIGKSLNE